LTRITIYQAYAGAKARAAKELSRARKNDDDYAASLLLGDGSERNGRSKSPEPRPPPGYEWRYVGATNTGQIKLSAGDGTVLTDQERLIESAKGLDSTKSAEPVRIACVDYSGKLGQEPG